MRVCEVEGCKRKYSAKGYCALHYQRNYRTGDVGPAGIIDRKKDVLTCATCHTKVLVVDMFKILNCKASRRAFCTEECWKIEILNMSNSSLKKKASDIREQSCKVLRSHDEAVKDDPEALGAAWIADFAGITCDSADEIREKIRKEIKGDE